jgi:hypothetical protein
MENYRNKFSNIQIKNHVRKKKAKLSKFVFLKRRGRKEAKKDLQLSGQWKVPSLVTLKRNPMLGGE